MDEAALREMMPMSFGKRKAPPSANQPPSPAKPTSDPSSSTLSSSLLGKCRADEASAREGEEDDGLTAEERAANVEAERRERERRAAGLGSDSDDSEDDSDDDSVGPPPPPASDPKTEYTLPPMLNEAHFKGQHSKTLSALAIDPSGARFAVGSYDYNLSLFDFGGMTSSFSPFRQFEPAGSYPVLDLDFSPDAGNLLVISGTSAAKVFTRDGAEVGECSKGDPYLRDMRRTTGHVGGLTCGSFHPGDAARFLTAGGDSTVRIWNMESFVRGHEDIIVLKSKARGNRTKVTALSCTKEGTVVAAGEDGGLSFWDLRSNLNSKPRGSVDHAHEAECITSSIAVKGNSMVSRGGDGTVKLWDLRSFRSPIATKDELANTSPHTSVIFDPFNGSSIVTAVSAVPITKSNTNQEDDGELSNTTGGKLVVLDSTNLDIVQTYSTSASSPVRLTWSSATDQLFTTFRDGSLRIYYTPSRSSKGITLAVSRAPKARTPFYSSVEDSGLLDSYPIDASSLPQSQSESAKRRRLAKERKDAAKTKLPQPPVSGPGKAGRIGVSAMQHVVQSLYGAENANHNEDPREALLKYANTDDNHQPEFTKAWNKTQPKPIFSKYTDDNTDNKR